MKVRKLSIIIHTITAFFLFSPAVFYAEQLTKEAIIDGLLSKSEKENKISITRVSNKKSFQLLQQISSLILSKENTNKKKIFISLFKRFPIEKTVPYCINILDKTKSFVVKKEIISYLSNSTNRRVVLPIVKELDNSFFTVRESAILALKKFGDDRMFPYIINMMEHKNPVFKVYALEAIYHLYDLRFYGQLISMLKDKNKSVRYYVLKCIEKNRLKDSSRIVRKIALSDKSWEVRIKAIQILGDFLDTDSMRALLFCLRDKNREVRFYSSRALRQLNIKASAKPISYRLFSESDDEIKNIFIDTLINLRDGGGYKGLRKVILNDKNIKIRTKVAYSLLQIRHRKSESLLNIALKDDSPEVRAEICNSLGYYKNRNSIIHLLNIINEDSFRYVRSAALYSIKKIGGKFAILPLFDRYTIELDPVFKDKIRKILRQLIKESI